MTPVVRFLAAVAALSVPFWLAGALVDTSRFLPVRLPISALQFLAVLAAALWSQKGAHGALVARLGDVSRIPAVWRPVLPLLMPAVIAAGWGLSLLGGGTIGPATPWLALPALLAVYSVSAACEQLGWTAVLTDHLLKTHTVWVAGLLVGLVWAFWHVIPFLQTGNPPVWVVGQSLFTVVHRVVLTEVYVRTQRSVAATVVLHATYDTAFTMLPTWGSSYQPWAAFAVTALAALLIRPLHREPARAEARSADRRP